MGLPIWRDPDESKSSSRNAPKPDPTACLRSSIRRRPSIHGNRRGRRGPALPRDPSVLPPRFARSPPPSVGFNGIREQRRGDDRGVPPLSNLLEVADRHRNARFPPPPPPPVPESGNYWRGTRTSDTAPSARPRFGAAPGNSGQSAEREYLELQRNQRLREIRNRARREELFGWRERPGQDFEVIDLSEDEHGESEENRALRRSPTPPANRNDPSVPMHTIVLNPGEPLRILRSPEPMRSRRRPDSRDGLHAHRSTLPTPPLETSAAEPVSPGSEPDTPQPGLRRAHPLSNTWRPESPVNGLGDRDRSPESTNAWEIMQTTITPDESLPSAESSFASAAASQSFNASSNNTQMTDQDSRVNSGEDSESGSSADPDDLCNDDEIFSTEAFAEDVYLSEMSTLEGRERIARHQEARTREGNRFALEREPPSVDIGFRLIEEALESEEGRSRVLHIRQNHPDDRRHLDVLTTAQRMRTISVQHQRRAAERSTRAGSPDGPVPPYRPAYSQEIRDVAQETSSQVHDYFRRYTPGATADGPLSQRPPVPRTRSPVPQLPAYESEQQDENALISHDGPVSHPVSPPSQRSEREVSEALLSGDVQSSDVQDLDSMRRIVERLAARDDVPEEWWMSMGLNLSRARPRDRSPRRRPGTVVAGPDEPTSRTRSGRIERHERGNSRL